MDEQWATPDDFTAIGVTYRCLDYWTRRGYLLADVTSPGSGYSRRWPVGELQIAQVMRDLITAGMSVNKASSLARAGAGSHVLSAKVALLIREEEQAWPSAPTASPSLPSPAPPMNDTTTASSAAAGSSSATSTPTTVSSTPAASNTRELAPAPSAWSSLSVMEREEALLRHRASIS